MLSKDALLLGKKIGTYPSSSQYEIKVSGFIRYPRLNPKKGALGEDAEVLIRKIRKAKFEYLVEFDCVNGVYRIYYWVIKGTNKTMKTKEYDMKGIV